MTLSEHFESLRDSLSYEKLCHSQPALLLGVLLDHGRLLLVVFRLFWLDPELILLFSESLFLFFDPGLGLWIWAIDDSQSQVQEEERSYKDQSDEEEKDEWCVCFLVHDHDVRPAFQGDALEDVEEWPEDVVEIGDIIVGIEGLFAAVVACRTFCVATDHFFTFRV